MKRVKVAVVGMGHVGLSLAILLSRHHDVTAVDDNQANIDMLTAGISPIQDAQMTTFLQTKKRSLRATTDAPAALREAELIVIATPAPYDPQQNHFDTTSIETILKKVEHINPKAAVVIKTTVPIGYTENISARFRTDRLLFSPEFLREGKALYDHLYPSRIIVGAPKDNVEMKAWAEIFARMMREGAEKKDVPVLITTPTEAEAMKLFANAYLAMRVAFFNELDTFAQMKDLNAAQIIQWMGLDPHIGDLYNNPSFGYGGYGLPEDTKQLLASFENVPGNLPKAIVESGSTRKDFIAEEALKKAGYPQNPQPVIGVYRLTMKSESNSLRHAAVQGIMERIEAKGIEMLVYEPLLQEDTFLGAEVVRDLSALKSRSDVILANRYHDDLADVMGKVYTRDLFHRD